jgi:hypothetical protein
LLLRGFEKFRQVPLRKPSLLTERGDLHGHIPSLTCALEPGGKLRILQLFFEVPVEIAFFHRSFLFRQSRIRSRAVLMARAGMACPLLRMRARQ